MYKSSKKKKKTSVYILLILLLHFWTESCGGTRPKFRTGSGNTLVTEINSFNKLESPGVNAVDVHLYHFRVEVQ